MNPYKTRFFNGNNDMGSFEIFVKRVFFDGFALTEDGTPKITIDEVKNLRFAEKSLHGKINPSQNAILPNQLRLVKLQDTENDVFVADFVASAFLDLKESINRALRSGNMSGADPNFRDFNAVSGWMDASTAYKIYLANFKNFFLKYIERLPIEKKSKIDDFSHFVDLFLEFYNFFSTSFPFTMPGFILSNMISNQCSGLMLTIAEYDYSSDEEKIKDFYNSQNFRFYKEAAISHGFLIDKNAPWRLIADIDNPVMQSYINRETLRATFDRSAFFDAYFVGASSGDMKTLKNTMFDFYNTAIAKNKIERTVVLDAKNCFEITSRRRKQKTPGQVYRSLNQEQWAYLYLKIRNLETQINYSEPELRSMAKNVADLKKKVDKATCMRYINNRFSEIPFSEGSLNYEITKIKLTESGRKADSTLSEEIKKKTRIKKRTLY